MHHFPRVRAARPLARESSSRLSASPAPSDPRGPSGASQLPAKVLLCLHFTAPLTGLVRSTWTSASRATASWIRSTITSRPASGKTLGLPSAFVTLITTSALSSSQTDPLVWQHWCPNNNNNNNSLVKVDMFTQRPKCVKKKLCTHVTLVSYIFTLISI